MDDPNRGAERMGMGKRKRSKQDSLFIPTASLARSPSHDFYERLNQVLSADGFDDFVEDLCEPFYVHLTESTPDHSTLSRIRQRLPVEATLAKASGIETPSRADLAKLDKKWPKKVSNDDWEHPHDPDAKVTKMKDRRTHLAHKVEHTVDLETQAIVAVSLADANEGDTSSLPWSLLRAETNLSAVATDPRAQRKSHDRPLTEVVADKGYHSNEVRSSRGQRLQKRRAELVERSFAHVYDTGAMRRLHLRGRGNILKRLLIHVGAFNLSLLMRQLLGAGTPRGFAALVRTLESIVAAFETGVCAIIALWRPSNTLSTPNVSIISIRRTTFIPPSIRRRSTGC
jgi:transposase